MTSPGLAEALDKLPSPKLTIHQTPSGPTHLSLVHVHHLVTGAREEEGGATSLVGLGREVRARFAPFNSLPTIRNSLKKAETVY